MPASKNLGAYADCHQAWETALVNEGAQVKFETDGKARNFQQRCYMYRRLIQKAHVASAPAGTQGTSPYDTWKIRREGRKLIFEENNVSGLQFKTLDGEPVQSSDAEVPRPLAAPDPDVIAESTDDLLEEAFDLAEELRSGKGLQLE